MVGDREPRDERRALRDERRVHLVHDDQGPVALRGVRDGGQLLGGVDDAGRVVRAAQEQHGAAGGGLGRVRSQGLVDRRQVQAALGGEGDRHDLPADSRVNAGEGRIHRAGDHHGSPGWAEALDQDPDPGHHVGAQGHVGRVRVPGPAASRRTPRAPPCTWSRSWGTRCRRRGQPRSAPRPPPARAARPSPRPRAAGRRAVVLPLDRRAPAQLLRTKDLERRDAHCPIVPQQQPAALHLGRRRPRCTAGPCRAGNAAQPARRQAGSRRRAGRRAAGPGRGGRGARPCRGR